MIRIILAIIGFMVMICVAHAFVVKPKMHFGSFAMMEPSQKKMIYLAQNDGNNNNQSGCGRRDTPPLSS